jgi:ppGpp synthetase/RelA/SpoT-type nucleotidyltranferase
MRNPTVDREPTYADYLGTLETNLTSLAYQIKKLRQSEPAMLRFPHSTHRIKDTESLIISMIEDAKLAVNHPDN